MTLESYKKALYVLINGYIENMMCNKPGDHNLLNGKT